VDVTRSASVELDNLSFFTARRTIIYHVFKAFYLAGKLAASGSGLFS